MISFLRAVAENSRKSKFERKHSNNRFSELLLSSNMRQHKTKYIQRTEQLSLSHRSNSYSESMQQPLHKYNSVQGNPCFSHLQRFEHFCLHPHLISAMHAFSFSKCCPDWLPHSTIHCSSKIVDTVCW